MYNFYNLCTQAGGFKEMFAHLFSQHPQFEYSTKTVSRVENLVAYGTFSAKRLIQFKNTEKFLILGSENIKCIFTLGISGKG